MNVVFTERAYISILSETAEKIDTETGGILLGYRNGAAWQVVESIDPGPKSIFEAAYFEYDQKYVNHLSNKIARLYDKPLELLGLWHRHPGSFDKFSDTDDNTNNRYLSLSDGGVISALVNIDPDFRLTVYYVSKPLRYTHIPYTVEKEIFPLCEEQSLLDYLSGRKSAIRGSGGQRAKFDYAPILNSIIGCLPEAVSDIEPCRLLPLSDDDVGFILMNIEEDMSYLAGCLELHMTLREKYLQIVCQGKKASIPINFFVHPQDKTCCIEYRGHCFRYEPRTFQTIFDELIAAVDKNVFNYMRVKELVKCSMKNMQKN